MSRDNNSPSSNYSDAGDAHLEHAASSAAPPELTTQPSHGYDLRAIPSTSRRARTRGDNAASSAAPPPERQPADVPATTHTTTTTTVTTAGSTHPPAPHAGDDPVDEHPMASPAHRAAGPRPRPERVDPRDARPPAGTSDSRSDDDYLSDSAGTVPRSILDRFGFDDSLAMPHQRKPGQVYKSFGRIKSQRMPVPDAASPPTANGSAPADFRAIVGNARTWSKAYAIGLATLSRVPAPVISPDILNDQDWAQDDSGDDVSQASGSSRRSRASRASRASRMSRHSFRHEYGGERASFADMPVATQLWITLYCIMHLAQQSLNLASEKAFTRHLAHLSSADVSISTEMDLYFRNARSGFASGTNIDNDRAKAALDYHNSSIVTRTNAILLENARAARLNAQGNGSGRPNNNRRRVNNNNGNNNNSGSSRRRADTRNSSNNANATNSDSKPRSSARKDLGSN